jgi:hypothetical protein
MNNDQITLKMTLALDKKWASNHSQDDLIEFIEHSFNTTLGFRGEIKKVRVVTK